MTASHLPGAHLRTSPSPRVRRVSPRVALRAVLVALALILLVVIVSGCGNAELPAAAPVATTPPPTTSATPAPTTTAPPTTTSTPTTQPTTGSATPSTEGRAAAPRATTPAPRAGGNGNGTGGSTGGRTPIWPATDAVAAKNLQKQVDGGREPWLLDPTEVATSYSGVALKYRNPKLFTLRPGVIDVQDGATRGQATITLAQTVRQGDGGIWLVTGVQRR